MKIFMLSDLHLRDPQQPFYQSVLKMLSFTPQPQDVLVLAGDIFDLFVGKNTFFQTQHADFLKLITELIQKKIQVYYIEGNHDFHMGEVLSPRGVTVCKDEVVLKVPEQKHTLYIAHGDLVDQEDHHYLKLRAIYRSKGMKWVSGVLPASLILKIAERHRRNEKDQYHDLPELWSEEKRNGLRKKFREFAEHKKRQGYDFILLGHCHDLDELESFYFNSGFPPKHRQYLVYDSESGLVERQKFLEH